MSVKTIKVKKGDTLSGIAKANNTTVDALAKANGIKDVNKIREGASISIALPSSTPSPVPAAGGSPAKKISGVDPNTLNLQKQLNTQNAGKAGWTPLKEDGILGPKTEAAKMWKGEAAPAVPLPGDQAETVVDEQPVVPDIETPQLPDTTLQPAPETVTADNGEEPAPGANEATLPETTEEAVVETPAPYSGSSIVDYLGSIGSPSDFASRFALAKANGISNYIGTADQNVQLLNTLRSQNPGVGNGGVATAGADAGMAAAAAAATEVTEDGQPVSEFQAGIESIMKEFGITPPSPNQSPQSSFSDVYKDVYDNLGLQDIKDQFNIYSKEYGDLMDKKTDDIMNVNNDPWLTEGVRKDRLAKIDEEYELRESNLLSKIKLTEGMYESGRQDAQFVTSGIMTQSNRTQDLNENIIMKAIDIAENRSQAEQDLLRDEKSTVMNLIETYPDAGILTTDTLETAASKASKSAYFEKRISSSGSGSTKTTFTTTQANKGAANAGMSIEEFMQFSDDTKNLFVNNPDFVTVFKEDVAAFNDGNLSRDEWIANIEGGTSNETVKQDLIDYINSLTEPVDTSGGFWDNPIVRGMVRFGERVINPPK